MRELTEAGLSTPCSRGRSGGRARSVSAASLDTARRLIDGSGLTMDEVAGRLGVPRSTLYRLLGPVIIKKRAK